MGGNLKSGASTTQGFIPLCAPEIRGNEWKYIKECLDTNWVSSVGPFVERFERELAEFAGAKQSTPWPLVTAWLPCTFFLERCLLPQRSRKSSMAISKRNNGS